VVPIERAINLRRSRNGRPPAAVTLWGAGASEILFVGSIGLVSRTSPVAL
jgi:hypothetical protein